MDLLDYLITNILALDPIIRWPGIFLIVLFLLRATGHIFRFRFISVITNVLYALVIALILARYGREITAFVMDFINNPSA